MNDLIAAVLARNSVELRALYSAIGKELKSRKVNGVPAKVGVKLVIPAPTQADVDKETHVKAQPTAKRTVGPNAERPFGVRCEATSKVLKRSYASAAEALAAASDLTVKMGRIYAVCSL